jgi:hypothetical protein
MNGEPAEPNSVAPGDQQRASADPSESATEPVAAIRRQPPAHANLEDAGDLNSGATPRNAFQIMAGLPIIGGWINLFVSILVPVFIGYSFFSGPGNYKSHIVVGVLLTLWNVFFIKFLRVSYYIGLVAGIALIFFGLYELVTGAR